MAMVEGRAVDARRLLQRALEVEQSASNEPGDLQLAARIRLNLGACFLALADTSAAAAWYEEASKLATRGSDDASQRLAEVGMAAVLLQRNQFDEAGVRSRAVAASARTAGDDETWAAAELTLGAALEGTDRSSEALEHYELALSIDRRLRRPHAVREDLRILARAYARAGKHEAAAAAWLRAARISRQLQAPEEAAGDLDRAFAAAPSELVRRAVELERQALGNPGRVETPL
jgi:tetratricopeptide (TPR) repeat protein